jgi:hypothetical protein
LFCFVLDEPWPTRYAIFFLVVFEPCLTFYSEAIISKDPLIAGAVIFGRGRTHNGVIISPAPAAALDVTDPVKISAYLDAIWWVLDDVELTASDIL